ncbi:MAG: hypothetical protein E7418_02705 [Ruminococcaceae bacterium]|nr:hypothetical protein [Oscillospiraceae bacterium]
MKEQYRKMIGQIMHNKWLIIIVMVGMCLMLLPDFFAAGDKEETKVKQSGIHQNEAYTKQLKTELEAILSEVQGVSHVRAMITLSDSGETYYAQNESDDSRNKTDGGLLEKNQQSSGSLALKNDAGGGQSPVEMKWVMPRISGVLVIAKGVQNPSVRMQVVSAVCAVLDVPKHRVEVLERG